MRLAALILLAAPPAFAESPLSAEQFEALAEGRTLTFRADGVPYGIERYMEGRRVLWSFLDGECSLGEWYQQDEAICFVYDHAPDDPQCWKLFREGEDIRAVFVEEGAPASEVRYSALEDAEEMICTNFGA